MNCFQQALNVTDPPSIYDYDDYQSVWLNTVCLLWNVTYSHRVSVHGALIARSGPTLAAAYRASCH